MRRSLLSHCLFLGDVPHSKMLKDTLLQEPIAPADRAEHMLLGDMTRPEILEEEHFETFLANRTCTNTTK